MRLHVAILAVSAVLPACLLKPDRVAATGDAGTDAGPDAGHGGAPVPRLIQRAWYGTSTPGDFSTGMSSSGYYIPTDGIQNGDLVLFIANVDNGAAGTWKLPTSSFRQQDQRTFGSDGETYFVAWTIASNEPAVYMQPYGPGINSASAAIALVAVSGVDPSNPITAHDHLEAAGGMTPPVAITPSVTTTVASSLLIYAAGADWLVQGGNNTFDPPSGFTKLASFGDNGDDTWNWTSLAIAYSVQANPGPSGAITGTLQSPYNGIAWGVDLAIAPPP